MNTEVWITIGVALLSVAGGFGAVAWRLGRIDQAVCDMRDNHFPHLQQSVARLYKRQDEKQQQCTTHEGELIRLDTKLKDLERRTTKLNGE